MHIQIKLVNKIFYKININKKSLKAFKALEIEYKSLEN